jgi:hypothetical protein
MATEFKISISSGGSLGYFFLALVVLGSFIAIGYISMKRDVSSSQQVAVDTQPPVTAPTTTEVSGTTSFTAKSGSGGHPVPPTDGGVPWTNNLICSFDEQDKVFDSDGHQQTSTSCEKCNTFFYKTDSGTCIPMIYNKQQNETSANPQPHSGLACEASSVASEIACPF